ncbi:carboxylic acid transporter [Histoplasma capsulatum var. duboisii H88]|uniref:Carboxylic acid transporter n=2 Tax=Ajellomyces capsulatus TaxID=5037 RepID=F0U672_AJEC8|nr:carboxylic acid transporter [Histoplasma capsulatum H143]EGC42255.1 carboxylic acid transporter [Histoplasma capsulatum var. duboisii H88]QSS51335.1 carboxylic acid transporter [Histoplasma capsulatum var. duboisii H88]
MSGNEPADPIPKAFIPAAKQAVDDLFRWKVRVEVTAPNGESFCEWQDPPRIRNPLSLCAQLKARDWLYFGVGLFAWIADAFDFHALSIQTVKLSRYYNQTKTSIATAITLTLLLRSAGAAVFGMAGDRWGRKWPMVLNMVVLGFLQIATIYSATFQQFLAVRSLFGLFMGGVYGNAIAIALENCPVEARGLMSGVLQQGYSMGYVFAACANLGVGGSTESWKIVFWIAAGLSFLAGALRVVLPESKQFRDAKRAGTHRNTSPGAFWRDTKSMLAKEWRLVVYCIILMAWFNFYSHTSQDSYTTFVLTQKDLDNSRASRASILMKVGACVGGTIIGYMSQFLGRRRSIILAALMSTLLIPAWILPEGEHGLSASAFFMQFFVQGAWGVIPIHLNELSPPEFRSSFPGVTYQLGNMISSPSAQIVNAIAEANSMRGTQGEPEPAYGPTMGIATAIIAVGIVVTTMFGPEKRGRKFEQAKVAGTVETTFAGEVDAKAVEAEDGVVKEMEKK